MKKLSEISMDTMLTVENQSDGDLTTMTKEMYLDSAQYLDYPVEPFTNVTIAKKQIIKDNLCSILEEIAEHNECYECWIDDVYNDLRSEKNVRDGCKKHNIDMLLEEAFKRYPIYWEGEKVEVDTMKVQDKQLL